VGRVGAILNLFCVTPRVGQNRVYTPYMTVYLVISRPNEPYIHRLYTVLANPSHTLFPVQMAGYLEGGGGEGVTTGYLYQTLTKPNDEKAKCMRCYLAFVGLARTVYKRCIYGTSGLEFTKYTVIYGVYIRF